MARKSTSRSRKSAPRDYDDVPDAGEVTTLDDEGFDAGLGEESEKPKAKASATKRRRRTTKTTEPDVETRADDEHSEKENGGGSGATPLEPPQASDDTPAEEADSEGAETVNGEPEVASESNDDPSEEGDGKRRRRRRRRRRGGARSGESEQPQSARGKTGRSPRPARRGSGASNGEEVTGTYEGILELHPKNYGFLRDQKRDYQSQDSDPFVSSSLIDKYGLREGVIVKGDVGPGSRNQGPRLKSIETIDGRTPEEFAEIRHFDDLTPINPFEQIRLERGPRPVTMRVMDLLTPIGKGQRALIVAPPRSGKTMLMQDIAQSVSRNHPEVHLVVLLIDERPEEVTEMRRMVEGEVIASSMDRDVESHVRVSQLLVERAKRMAEAGQHVLILLDSITRLGRAFNKWVGNSGRTGTGGLDVRALDIPRKMFGTARRFDEGGSLTVIGTALVETGSRADDAIFQEFKGTGNMELVLNRDLADRRIFPAMDIEKSGTRREEKLLAPDVLEGVTMLRRSLVSLSPVEAMEQLIRTLERFDSNAEFLQRVRSVL